MHIVCWGVSGIHFQEEAALGIKLAIVGKE